MWLLYSVCVCLPTRAQLDESIYERTQKMPKRNEMIATIYDRDRRHVATKVRALAAFAPDDKDKRNDELPGRRSTANARKTNKIKLSV